MAPCASSYTVLLVELNKTSQISWLVSLSACKGAKGPFPFTSAMQTHVNFCYFQRKH